MSGDQVCIGKRWAGGAPNLPVVDQLTNLSQTLVLGVWRGKIPVVRR
jgi:hypothetical protein